MSDASAENKIMKKAKIEYKFEKEIRKNKRKSQKSYSQHVKERKGEYRENKPINRSTKLKKNNYGEMIAVENGKNKSVPWKKPQKAQTVQIETGKFIQTSKHPRGRKTFLSSRWQRKIQRQF